MPSKQATIISWYAKLFFVALANSLECSNFNLSWDKVEYYVGTSQTIVTAHYCIHSLAHKSILSEFLCNGSQIQNCTIIVIVDFMFFNCWLFQASLIAMYEPTTSIVQYQLPTTLACGKFTLNWLNDHTFSMHSFWCKYLYIANFWQLFGTQYHISLLQGKMRCQLVVQIFPGNVVKFAFYLFFYFALKGLPFVKMEQFMIKPTKILMYLLKQWRKYKFGVRKFADKLNFEIGT